MLAEYSATLGIDIETASNKQLAARAFDFCGEMVECYEEGSLEAVAFQTIQMVLLKMNGGTFREHRA